MSLGLKDVVAKWRAERNEALRNLDVAWFLRETPGAAPDVVLIAIHKARYECVGLESQLRMESGEWLRSHGYARMNGLDLLPPGELPK